MKAGRFRHRVTLERRITSQDPIYGTEKGVWSAVATDIPAEVQDVLPSRSESIDEGISLQRRPCRVRIRYRTDVTSDMRLDIGGRKLRIVGGPAEMGHREALEMVCEELSTSGEEP